MRVERPLLSWWVDRAANRRDFLKRTLTGAVSLGAAGLLSRCTGGQTGPAPALTFFNPQELRTMTALSQAVLPGRGTDAAVQTVPAGIDREVRHWSARNQSQLRSLLALMEDGTRYFFFSWQPFSKLPLEARRRYLLEWQNSTIDLRREAYQALRMMAFFYYYAQDSTWRGIGYDGPWLKPATPS